MAPQRPMATLVVHRWNWQLRPAVVRTGAGTDVGSDSSDDEEFYEALPPAEEGDDDALQERLARERDSEWANVWGRIDGLVATGGDGVEQGVIGALRSFFATYPEAPRDLEHPSEGDTMLSRASKKHWSEVVRYLLEEAGAQPRSTELQDACQELQGLLLSTANTAETETIRLLVQANAPTSITESISGFTLLHRALVTYPSLETLELFVGTDVDATRSDNSGYTPITYAILRERADAVNLIIRRMGVNANARDGKGRTPLIQACIHDGLHEIVELLLAAGADPLATFSRGAGPNFLGGMTALHVAASNGATYNVRRLLNAGANPNTRNSMGETPYSAALKRGWWEVTDALAATTLVRLEPNFRRTAYLDTTSLVAARNNQQHVRGFAAYLWSHKWDKLINLYRRYGEAVTRHMLPVDTPEDYVAAVAMFCPIGELRVLLGNRMLGLPDVRVRREDSGYVVTSGVHLELGSFDAARLQEAQRKIVDGVFVPHLQERRLMLAATPVGPEERLARHVWLSVLGRMDAALNSLCRPEQTGRRVYRYLSRQDDESMAKFSTQSTTDILARMGFSWVSTSTDENRARSFCRSVSQGGGAWDYRDCLRLVIELEPHTLAVDISEVVTGGWLVYLENEVLLPPGVRYRVLADLHNGERYGDDADAIASDFHRTLVLQAYGGRSVQYNSRAGPNEDDGLYRL